MAELVDALDSGSSGQYACGGSSPPFRTWCLQGDGLWRLLIGRLVIALLCACSIGCTPRGSTELDEVRRHTETMIDIMHRHRHSPSVALTQLEQYESDHRAELKILNDKINDLRPQLTSAEKRFLAERWQSTITEVRERIKFLRHSQQD